jgi:hypothetical protein
MAAQRSVGVSKEEGWRLKRQFDKGYRGLVKWWKSQHATAKRQKYVTTSYGRKYPLPDIDHELGGFRSKAERNSVNGPVQGTCADIMKLAMALLHREIHKRGWQDIVLMTITIHDELVFEIREDVAAEAVDVIEDVMINRTVGKLGWAIPLTVDIEFGNDWTVPNNLTKMTHNQGGGDWDPRLAGIFPARYQKYLDEGGTPTGAPAPPVPQGTVSVEIADDPPEIAVEIPENGGGEHIYRLAASRLTPEVAERLARVIARCRGRGTDTLRIETESGEDLLGDAVKVSLVEFQIVTRYEGL